MDVHGIDQVTGVLQMSISPVALISGVGLLLLSMTNRVGRTTDLVRGLAREARTATALEREVISAQIRILYQRSNTLSISIGLAVTSILFTAVIVFCLFAISFFRLRLEMLVMALWIGGMAALIASLGLFLRDNMLILRALRLEARRYVVEEERGHGEEKPGHVEERLGPH
ncbi:MAG: DUF2721 domain-containing protein [Armatimonadetes bacterium]|nr:DUF2721 domain-containing protein [Armatimonadota bacterium]